IDSSEWGVTYEPMKICAVEGSTVRINCTYSHPGEVTVEKEMWFYGIEKSEIKRDEATTVYHTNESEVSGSHRHRVQFLGNKNKTCSLEISKVSREDFGYYKFRYEGRDSGKHWTQMPGVHMTITDLKIEVTAENVQENDAVTLSCKTTCRHPSRVFSWYRDGHQLKETSETLEIQRVSYQDHAKYSCQTGGIMSSQFLLNVQYPPRYAVITGQSNSSLEEGGSVTLYCKALANPTSNYTWVKESRSQVGSGEQLHICSVNRGHAGSYHCEATNRYGTAKSAVVILAFQDAPKNAFITVKPSTHIEEGESVMLHCKALANPHGTYTWVKENTSHVGTGEQLHISEFNKSHQGSYYCEATNNYGMTKSAAVQLTINDAPRNVVITGHPTTGIEEGTSVTLNCRALANPPGRYTWVKENSGQVGSGDQLHISKFNASHAGSYHCEATNDYGTTNSTAVNLTVNGE
ncbi:CD22 protein, partial [Polypterus senegalus]|nr:CD22 protein [Polypterus senegalus]